MKSLVALVVLSVLLKAGEGSRRYPLGSYTPFYSSSSSPPSRPRAMSPQALRDCEVDLFDIIDSNKDKIIDLHDFQRIQNGRAIDSYNQPRIVQEIGTRITKQEFQKLGLKPLDLSKLNSGRNYDKYNIIGLFGGEIKQAEKILEGKASKTPLELASFFKGNIHFD